MTQGSPQFEIEDVLASIRRLVTEDRQAAVAEPLRPRDALAPSPAPVSAMPAVSAPAAMSEDPSILQGDRAGVDDSLAAAAPLAPSAPPSPTIADDATDILSLDATLDAIEAAMAHIDAEADADDAALADAAPESFLPAEEGTFVLDADALAEAALDQDWDRAEIAVELSFDEDTPDLTPPSPEAEPPVAAVQDSAARPLVYLAHELEDAEEPAVIDWDEKPQSLEWSAPGAPEEAEGASPTTYSPAPEPALTAQPASTAMAGRRLHLLAGTEAAAPDTAVTVTEMPEDLAEDLPDETLPDAMLPDAMLTDATLTGGGDNEAPGDSAWDVSAEDLPDAAEGDGDLATGALDLDSPAPLPGLPPEPLPGAGPDDTFGDSSIPSEAPAATAPVLDEAALRDTVADLIRQELQGVLGERITQNLRKLIQREIQRALAARDLE